MSIPGSFDQYTTGVISWDAQIDGDVARKLCRMFVHRPFEGSNDAVVPLLVVIHVETARTKLPRASEET
jgi:hypothetical protein